MRALRAVTTTRTIQVAGLVGLVAVLGAAALVGSVPALTDPTVLGEWLAGLGPLAPVAYVGVQAAQVLVAPIPGQVVAFVGGYLFGPIGGTALSVLGGAIGTALAVGLVRQFGRPFVERSVPPATLDRYDAVLDRRGRTTLFALFVMPGLPDDVLCLLAGLTRIPIGHVVAIAVVGRLPGYLLLAIAGSRAHSPSSPCWSRGGDERSSRGCRSIRPNGSKWACPVRSGEWSSVSSSSGW